MSGREAFRKPTYAAKNGPSLNNVCNSLLNRKHTRWLFDVDGHRQVPPALFLLWAVGIGVLVVPEPIWIFAGVHVTSAWGDLSPLLRYQLIGMEHKNAAYVFWVLSPFVFLLTAAIFIVKYNGSGFPAYRHRREARLRSQGKRAGAIDVRLIFGATALTLGYFWALFYGRLAPSILGDFVPTKNRAALVAIHGGALYLIMPLCIAVVVTEIRATFYARRSLEGGIKTRAERD